MSTSSSAIFSGNSRYSTDFQQVITRSVKIASLPLTLMQDQKGTLIGEATALASLDNKFASVQSALAGFDSAVSGTGTYSSSVSDTEKATAAISTGVLAGKYTLTIDDLGDYSTVVSSGTPAVSDPASGNISNATELTLTVGGGTVTIAPGASLNELAANINKSGLAVQATVVTVGSDYRLSLESTKLGELDISLTEGVSGPNLLATTTQGRAASYSVNGLSTTTGDSRSVSIAPGLTVNLLDTGTTTITVSRDTSGIKAAMNTLAAAVNAAVDELDTHRGGNIGALSGQALVRTLADTLREVGSYEGGTGEFGSLAGLGLEFDKDGKLVFDSSAFDDRTTGKIDDVLSFLGGTTTSGFLKSATDTLNGIENATTGIVKTAIQTVEEQKTSADARMEAEQLRINQFEANLRERMAASDAIIAALEQQASYFTNMFEAMRSSGYNS